MEVKGPVLIFGLDHTLLKTRRWILESRGYSVVGALHLSEFTEIPEVPAVPLLILCHSLDPEMGSRALAVASHRWPGIKCIALARSVLTPSATGEVVLALEGPVRLLSAVENLLGETPVRRTSA